jgi:putative hydrolase of the HAD superfamily
MDAFIASIRFEPIAGAVETLASLRARGIDLAVVSNWDVGLEEHLERLGAARLFSTIVTSAEAGAAKPDPAIFRVALDRLGVDPARAVHIGDEPEDAEGAAAAGLGFLSVPLATAFEDWK